MAYHPVNIAMIIESYLTGTTSQDKTTIGA
jgi:hypothetical protein